MAHKNGLQLSHAQQQINPQPRSADDQPDPPTRLVRIRRIRESLTL